MNDWDALMVGYSGQAMAPGLDWHASRALAARRRVLRVTAPTFSQAAVRRRAWRDLAPAVEAVDDNLRVLRPVLPPCTNRPWSAPLGDALIEAQIRLAAGGRTGDRHRALIVMDERRGHLPGVERDLLVYWQADKVRLSRRQRAEHPQSNESRYRRLLEHADLFVGVSPDLVDAVEGLGCKAVLIRNGCEYDLFARPAPPPPDWPDGKRPVIGFVGGVSWRFDVELLTGLADARPDWTFLLVGEVVVPLPTRPNVLVMGHRPYEEMAAWAQRFDVSIVPYVTDDYNKASYPMKVFEYLAAGRPVVSTGLPALAGLEPHVRLADGVDDFIGAIEEALVSGPDPASCQVVARANDWDARVRQLEAEVDSLFALRSSPATVVAADEVAHATPRHEKAAS